MHSNDYAVFLGPDVGKGEHHAVGLAPDGKRLHDAPLPNTEERLKTLYGKLSRHGKVLVVVDQPASIGAIARRTLINARLRRSSVFARSADLALDAPSADGREQHADTDI